jgi:hypothetical protein
VPLDTALALPHRNSPGMTRTFMEPSPGGRMKASREHQAEKSGISSRIGYHRLVPVGPRHLGSHHHRRPPIQGKEGVVDKPIRDGFDKSWEGYSLPAKYLLMVEFESLAMAPGSMPYVNVKPEILFVHGPKV